MIAEVREGPSLLVHFDNVDLEELLEIVQLAAAEWGSPLPRKGEPYDPGILEALHLAVIKALNSDADGVPNKEE